MFIEVMIKLEPISKFLLIGYVIPCSFFPFSVRSLIIMELLHLGEDGMRFLVVILVNSIFTQNETNPHTRWKFCYT